MPETVTLGTDFARALAAKEFDRVRELLHPEIDFAGMTPRRSWRASDPDTVIADILAKGSKLYVSGERPLIERAFGKQDNGVIDLPDVMSRKKQVAPRLLKALSG